MGDKKRLGGANVSLEVLGPGVVEVISPLRHGGFDADSVEEA